MFRSYTRRDLLQAYRALTTEGNVYRFDESQWRAIQTLNDLIPQVHAARDTTWINAKRFERPSVHDDSVGDQLRRMADENKRRLKQQLEGQHAHAVRARVEGIVEASSNQGTSSPSKEKQQRKKNAVYLYGGVGTGKTMVMDMFRRELVHHRVLRMHFYEFLVYFHQEIRTLNMNGFTKVECFANTLCDRWDALCLDEMQLCDVQDVVVLPVILDILFRRGLTCVLTSNTEPNLLFANGLNRHVHLPPLLTAMSQAATVRKINTTDYRVPGEKGAYYGSTYALRAAFIASATRSTSSGSTDTRMDTNATVHGNGAEIGRTTLHISPTRRFTVESQGDTVWIDFGEMEYMHVCRRFAHIYLASVPAFAAVGDYDSLRRFVKFLDIAYDHSPRPALSISGAPLDVMFQGITQEVRAHSLDDLAWRTAKHSLDGIGKGLAPQAVGTIYETVRASERAASRLKEMCPS